MKIKLFESFEDSKIWKPITQNELESLRLSEEQDFTEKEMSILITMGIRTFSTENCPICDGHGYLLDDLCHYCNGDGFMKDFAIGKLLDGYYFIAYWNTFMGHRNFIIDGFVNLKNYANFIYFDYKDKPIPSDVKDKVDEDFKKIFLS